MRTKFVLLSLAFVGVQAKPGYLHRLQSLFSKLTGDDQGNTAADASLTTTPLANIKPANFLSNGASDSMTSDESMLTAQLLKTGDFMKVMSNAIMHPDQEVIWSQPDLAFKLVQSKYPKRGQD